MQPLTSLTDCKVNKFKHMRDLLGYIWVSDANGGNIILVHCIYPVLGKQPPSAFQTDVSSGTVLSQVK